MEKMNWFERKFAFDLPAWMFPNVVERLRGTPSRAALLVAGVGKEILTRRDDELWSIQENVGHLLDLEALWLGRVDDIAQGKEQLREADLTNQKSQDACHNAANMAELLLSLRDARAKFVKRLEELDDAAVEQSAMHPRLEQPMRVLDLIFFVAEHDDHHLAQIARLKKL